jgi:hypothetical protein
MTTPKPRKANSTLLALMAIPLLLISIGTAWWVFNTVTERPGTPAAPDASDSAPISDPDAAMRSLRQGSSPVIRAPEPVETRPPAPTPVTATQHELPALNESDPVVLDAVAGLDSATALGALLIPENLLLKAVRAVVALDENEVVKDYRPVLTPETSVRVIPLNETLDPELGQRYRLDPANYARYTPYIEALETVDPDALAALYQQFYPLLEEAYRQYGVDRGSFRTVTLRAIDRLLAIEVKDEQPVLIQPKVFFQYQDPKIEARSAPHKLLMRMGRDNAVRLQNALRRLRSALQAD